MGKRPQSFLDLPVATGSPSGDSFWQTLRRQLRRSCRVYSTLAWIPGPGCRLLHGGTRGLMQLVEARTPVRGPRATRWALGPQVPVLPGVYV